MKEKSLWGKTSFLWNTLEPWREMIHRASTSSPSFFFFFFCGRDGIILSRTPSPNPSALDQLQMRGFLRPWWLFSFSPFPSRVQDRQLWVLLQQRLLHQVQVRFLPTQRALLWQVPRGLCPPGGDHGVWRYVQKHKYNSLSDIKFFKTILDLRKVWYNLSDDLFISWPKNKHFAQDHTHRGYCIPVKLFHPVI